MKAKDMTGMKFGRLTVIKDNGSNKYRFRMWLCKCDCGNEVSVNGRLLRNEETKSCGCLVKDTFTEHLKRIQKITHKHNLAKNKLYMIWYDMVRRCTNPKRDSYHNYGGRGIKVCDRWMNLENFVMDMNESYLAHSSDYGDKNTTLERSDVDGDYNPENCTWATIYEQSINRRTNVVFEIDGVHLSLAEISKKYNVSYATLHKRVSKYGFSIEDAVNKPIKRKVVQP